MFITPKKKKTNKIANPRLAEKMRKLTAMYPTGNWRRDPFQPNNKVNKNYKKRTNAAKIIQRTVRLLRNIQSAKQLSPSKRTVNNPLWKKFVNYQMKRANESWRRTGY
jgi:hypothetical protein